MIFLSFKAVGKEIAHGLFFGLKGTTWMNIVLIGYRCSGKTHVGRLLAEDLGMTFLDTDRLIEEKTGMAIPAHVSLKGWGSFRRMERRIVQEIADRDNSVIATGGGIVIDPENATSLKENGWVVWLVAGPAAIRERMAQALKQGDLRPPLSGKDPLEEIESILRVRTPLYEATSDCCVVTEGHTPDTVTRMILDIFSRRDTGCMRRNH